MLVLLRKMKKFKRSIRIINNLCQSPIDLIYLIPNQGKQLTDWPTKDFLRNQAMKESLLFQPLKPNHITRQQMKISTHQMEIYTMKILQKLSRKLTKLCLAKKLPQSKKRKAIQVKKKRSQKTSANLPSKNPTHQSSNLKDDQLKRNKIPTKEKKDLSFLTSNFPLKNNFVAKWSNILQNQQLSRINAKQWNQFWENLTGWDLVSSWLRTFNKFKLIRWPFSKNKSSLSCSILFTFLSWKISGTFYKEVLPSFTVISEDWTSKINNWFTRW